jgi:hypothetical protein
MAAAIDLIAHVERHGSARRVVELAAVQADGSTERQWG